MATFKDPTLNLSVEVSKKSGISVLKEEYGKIEAEWRSELEAIEKEKSAAETTIDICDSEMQQALLDGNSSKYISAKSRRQSALDMVDYCNAQVKLANKRKASAVEKLAPIMEEIYSESMDLYKRVCADCLEKIVSLRLASANARDIVSNYNMAADFFRNYVEHGISILGGKLPNVFPNMLATKLADTLKYQESEMQSFINP